MKVNQFQVIYGNSVIGESVKEYCLEICLLLSLLSCKYDLTLYCKTYREINKDVVY